MDAEMRLETACVIADLAAQLDRTFDAFAKDALRETIRALYESMRPRIVVSPGSNVVPFERPQP